MHLFITDFKQQGEEIMIHEERVVKHMGKVLRMQEGEYILVQKPVFRDSSEHIQRYVVEITGISKQQIYGKILSCKSFVKDMSKIRKITMGIALPNTGSKLSLIVQKLTEVGVDDIIFRKAHRSQMKGLSLSKIEKLQKVALEASEQSQRRTLPYIHYLIHTEKILSLGKGKLIIFDIPRDKDVGLLHIDGKQKELCGIIGPEGGLSEQDYEYFGDQYHIVSLGETVLRMETAAIVGGWKLVNDRV